MTIARFRQVDKHLYRGSAPSVKDVASLKNDYGVSKIVSLDAEVGRKIHRAAQLLGIKHVIIPIDINKRSSLLKFLQHDLYELLHDDKNGNVFISCAQGKDRTGLAIALYRIKYQDWECTDALDEAHKLGFGIGVDPKIIKLYIKIIQSACPYDDHKVNGHISNDVDDNSVYDSIVGNQREYPSDYRDYTQDAWSQQSWAPYEDYRVREWPLANVDVEWPEQYQNRQDYGLDDREMLKHRKHNEIPQIGQYDNATNGINGAGPSMVGSGTL